LQFFGCKLHKNAFGGRPAGEAIALPRPLTLAVIRTGEGGKGKKRVGDRERDEGKG